MNLSFSIAALKKSIHGARDPLAGKPVERKRLEFKEGWNPTCVLHTLCEFANDFHDLGDYRATAKHRAWRITQNNEEAGLWKAT